MTRVRFRDRVRVKVRVRVGVRVRARVMSRIRVRHAFVAGGRGLGRLVRVGLGSVMGFVRAVWGVRGNG